MDKFREGKWGSWVAAVGVLLRLFAVISAQPGFLSIYCGGKTNQTAENNITWVSDASYINVGQTGKTSNPTFPSYMQTLRVFPKPLNKSCYQLPVTPYVPYLLRLWFVIGNYNGFQKLPSFSFSIETVDMLAEQKITLTDTYGVHDERIFATAGTTMHVCLVRTLGDDPFINAIELRTLRNGMYAEAKPGTMLILESRLDFGGNSTIRYSEDKFDRMWFTANGYLDTQNKGAVRPVSSQESISTNSTEDFPPMAVMQTAWVINGWDPVFGFFPQQSSVVGTKSLLLLYLAEIDSESTSFNVTINTVTRHEITLVRNYSAVELSFLSDETDIQLNLVQAANSNVRPIINAYEVYILLYTQQPTSLQDVEALDGIKRSLNITDWVSDPCFLIQWNGIGCDSSSSPTRILEMDLSGRNITGSVPKDIGQLTAVVNVSLNDNDLMGPLPDFSNLTILERLYLQNNRLNGSVPDWLSDLKNLKELYIDNNNFSGVIPKQLLLNSQKGSLKLSYAGNPYLCMHKGECIIKDNNKLKIVLGITLSGILIILVSLIVGIVLYRNKFRRKEKGVATIKKSKRLLDQDYSNIMMPNSIKSRGFTLDEMVTATQTFSREIGRGGFGSVFFGKLPEGNDIAVKVLSSFSQQGIREFLNEVDLLSRINHRNLVSLLGYCNESRELMLIYNYMAGGSLKDRLYGSTAQELSWKARLKITLDAAQGLKYLHVGSTPNIIHRDVKTSNILLDGNMNAKLADFGLSRMTIDEELSHVTTAVRGTAGYVDPEYYSTQKLTDKSDVYSFGVVLLEIVCGRQPIDAKLPVDKVNIIRWVTPYILEMDENGNKITEIIDKRLCGDYDMKSITLVVKLAMRCLHGEASCRPSVSEIVAELKEAIKHEDESSISIREEIGIQGGIFLSDPVYVSVDWNVRKGMEWGDNSSNISKVGR